MSDSSADRDPLHRLAEEFVARYRTLRLQRTRPFLRVCLDRGAYGSLLMAFRGPGIRGLQGTSPPAGLPSVPR